MVRIADPARESAPWICIRQLGSSDTTVRAPVRSMASILVRAMAPESSANFTENVPPKPQHSSAGMHLAQLEAADIRQQAARRALDPELAQRMAAVVERDDLVEPRADVFDAGDFGEERGEFEDAFFQGVDARERLRLLVEQLGEMMRRPSTVQEPEGTTIVSLDSNVSRKWRATVRASAR